MSDIFQGQGAPLTQATFDKVATALKGAKNDAAALWALVAVETRGFGFLPDRRPKILFERHVFDDLTRGRYSKAYPDISNPDPGGYAGGGGEYPRLKRAMLLDRDAALKSASWGLGQVMGGNAVSLGYADVDDMIRRFTASEDQQLLGVQRFIENRAALASAFDSGTWNLVAKFYNGKNYAKNAYDKKLAAAYATYSTDAGAQPDIGVRAIQARLVYLGFDPKGVDGLKGNGTTTALMNFQKRYGVGDRKGGADAATLTKLVDLTTYS